MTTAGLASLVPLAIGQTGFAALTWGAVGLVLVAFAYVVWALFGDGAQAG